LPKLDKCNSFGARNGIEGNILSILKHLFKEIFNYRLGEKNKVKSLFIALLSLISNIPFVAN
jgi:hypothetical protein